MSGYIKVKNAFKYTRAFSLIELMVVIGIVAVLSAVAIPQYKDYVAKAGATKGYSISRNFIDKGFEFYNQKGMLPYISELGLTPRNGSANLIAGSGSFPMSALAPHLFMVQVNPYSPSTYMGGSPNYGCAIGDSSFIISPSKHDILNSTDEYFYVSVSSFLVGTTFYTVCSYYNTTKDYIPSCYRLTDSTQSAAHTAKMNSLVSCNPG